MDLPGALRILGLPESAAPDQVRTAYWRLRLHVEERLRTADTPELRAARAAELRELEAMLVTLTPALEPDTSRLAALPRTWLVGWAGAASLAALLLAAFALGWLDFGPSGPRALIEGGTGGGSGEGGIALEGEGEGDGTGDGGADESVSAAERARVVAQAEVEGAELEIEALEDGAVVASGPADESAYWLVPGEYRVRVRHADCPDVWEHSLAAEAGGEHELAPRLCTETGWLVVRSNVEGDELLINGSGSGPTGPERRALPAGEHEVRVEKAGYRPWEGVVELAGGQVLTLKPRLERDPQASPSKEQEARERRAAAQGPGSAGGMRQVAAAAPPEPQGSKQAGRGGNQYGTAEDGAMLRGRWHEDTKQFILSRYDADGSGLIDTRAELAAIPCDYWKGIEASHDRSGLGVAMTRMYGFDGAGWKKDALGISSEIRDLAFARMRECGLRY